MAKGAPLGRDAVAERFRVRQGIFGPDLGDMPVLVQEWSSEQAETIASDIDIGGTQSTGDDEAEEERALARSGKGPTPARTSRRRSSFRSSTAR